VKYHYLATAKPTFAESAAYLNAVYGTTEINPNNMNRLADYQLLEFARLVNYRIAIFDGFYTDDLQVMPERIQAQSPRNNCE
jgi:hypothetical protein